MPIENIIVCTGQAGCQIGSAIWEILSAEHGIQNDGTRDSDYAHWLTHKTELQADNAFFHKTASDHYVPRTIFVDLEPSVLDEIRNGHYRDFFSPELLISGQEDAANIFARGYYTIASLHIERVMECFRVVTEQCDNKINLLLVHSTGGGCGSGFTSLLLDNLLDVYPKHDKFECVVSPSFVFSVNMVEPYNAVLSTHYNMAQSDIAFLLDNAALYSFCTKHLSVHAPRYSLINRMVSQVFSGMTASTRFGGELSANLNDYQTSLVPYPRIHFSILSYSPLGGTNADLNRITRNVFQNNHQLCTLNADRGRYVSCVLMYRGSCIPLSKLYACLSRLKKNKSIRFVDWCPTGFKVSICDMAPTCIGHNKTMQMILHRNVLLMMSNSSALREPFHHLLNKFQRLYSKRAYMHWYVGEGMEESEFEDASENVETLIQDYDACFHVNKASSKQAPHLDHEKRSNSSLECDQLKSQIYATKNTYEGSRKANKLYKNEKNSCKMTTINDSRQDKKLDKSRKSIRNNEDKNDRNEIQADAYMDGSSSQISLFTEDDEEETNVENKEWKNDNDKNDDDTCQSIEKSYSSINISEIQLDRMPEQMSSDDMPSSRLLL